MLKFCYFLFCFLIICGCANKNTSSLNVKPADKFPQWLKDSLYFTNQTSGITFIGNDNKDGKVFLLADDIGELHHLIITGDTILNLSGIKFSEKVLSFLSEFPKKDFEEILYDKYSGNVYLSIEGNGNDFKKYAGIYRIFFHNNNVFSDSVTLIEKLNISPAEEFLKNINNNTGYEGLAADENYFYLGLEGFSEANIFADSTIILIVDKKELKIIKEISTKNSDIYTICGLYSDKNFSLYGIDRNNKKLFHILLDENLNIDETLSEKIETNIPGFSSIDYVASLEAVTMDNENNIYLVDDPWRAFFIPRQEVLEKLDEETVKNFRNFVPVIFKFSIN